MYLTFIFMKPKIEQSVSSMELLEITLRNPACFGKRLGEVMTALPANVQIVALRHEHHNVPASPDIIIAEDDVVLAVGPDREALDKVRANLGEAAPGRVAGTGATSTICACLRPSRPWSAVTLGDVKLPGEEGSIAIQVRRGDADLLTPDLLIEFGDRIGVLANRSDFPAIRQYFGDSIKATAEFSYISIGLGMALGFLVGAITVAMPGIGKVSLGLAGVLLAALVLGKLRHTGRVNWTIPLSANLVLRNLGLTVFLAQVGMSSGPKFAATVSETGFLMLGLATVTVLSLVLPVLLLGLFVFRMRYDEVAGIVAGATGNPAILSYANKWRQLTGPTSDMR